MEAGDSSEIGTRVESRLSAADESLSELCHMLTLVDGEEAVGGGGQDREREQAATAWGENRLQEEQAREQERRAPERVAGELLDHWMAEAITGALAVTSSDPILGPAASIPGPESTARPASTDPESAAIYRHSPQRPSPHKFSPCRVRPAMGGAVNLPPDPSSVRLKRLPKWRGWCSSLTPPPGTIKNRSGRPMQRRLWHSSGWPPRKPRW